MEWWNGIVECVLQGERSLLMQFFTIVTPQLKCVTMAWISSKQYFAPFQLGIRD